MATTSMNSNMSPSRRSEEHDDYRQSRLEAVREYEGDGAGTVLNERYTRGEYTKRRLGFLSRHPDFENDIKLLPKVRRDAEEVFDVSVSAILSAQVVRQRELDFEIDPLLPLPTSHNTETIDSHSTYPTTEWVPGMPTDQAEILQQVQPLNSPTPPPATMAAPEARGLSNSVGNESLSVQGRRSFTPPIVTGRFDSVRNSPKHQLDQTAAAVSDRPTQSDNWTQRSTSNNLPDGNIDQTQQTANTSTNRATSNTSQGAATTSSTSNTMADTAVLNPLTPAQLQNVLELLARPRDNGIGAVAGRPVNVPVKPQGTKRSAPQDTDETGESAPDASAPPSPKKIKLHPPKTPSAAEPVPPARGNDALMTDAEANAAATAPSSRRKKPAAATSEASGSGPVRSTVAKDVASGLALPANKKTATAAQELRREHLEKQRASKRKGMRAADLKPEFWLKENITGKAVDEGPVRCVCGSWADDGETADNEYAGCDRITSCGSWQHVACVGGAFGGHDKPYKCHQCDPYRHREVLQKLRRGEEVKRPER